LAAVEILGPINLANKLHQ